MQNTYIIYKFLTMKILKISTITVAVLVAVFIIIACIFPPIAKNYINKHSKELIGRQINIKGLYINIFTGYARITDFQLLEANDLDTFVSFDTLSVDMSLHRLLANEVRINHISLTNPSVKVLQQGSEFNFDDLLALGSTDTLSADSPAAQPVASSTLQSPASDSLSPASPATTSANPLAIALYNISIQGGHILYKDLERNSVWQMENFGLQIPGVYFSGQNTDVGIALNFNDGGHLQTAIQYNMEAGNYLLDIDLTNFSIAPIQPYLTDFTRISTIGGILNTHLNIEGNAEHVTELVVRGNLGINHLSLADASHKEVLATDSIYIDMETINPGKAIFHFNTIAVNGIKTGFELRKDGNTMSDLFPETPEDTVRGAAEQTPAAGPQTTATAPDFKVSTFRINNSLFTFKDQTLRHPFTFSLENINLVADQLSLTQENKAKVSSTLKNGGTIIFNYEGKLDDLSNTDILLSINNLDLKTFTPYSMQYFGYPLQKGILSFSSVNNIRKSMLDGRNNLNIAKCEVGNKHKDPKPDYNIPLKTALYLIKDKDDLIRMDLPVKGDINSPEFSYRKIIFKTLTNLLVKVAVSPVNFLANSLGFSPEKLKNLPFEAVQNDFTPEQLTQINQLAEIIKAKPEMTLLLEQFVNVQQSKVQLADFYVKRNYYLQQHPEKSQTTLLPIDYSKIMEIDTKDIQFLNYVGTQVSEDKKTAYLDDQLLSLADSTQLNQLPHQLMDRRNQVLKEYLLRQEVPEKCIRISTATAEKLVAYKGKNQYTIGLVFAGDEPDPELIAEETEN